MLPIRVASVLLLIHIYEAAFSYSIFAKISVAASLGASPQLLFFLLPRLAEFYWDGQLLCKIKFEKKQLTI